MDLLTIGLILLAFGLLLAVAEVLIPSGGLLGLIAGGLIIGAVVCGWRYSPGWGVALAATAVVLVPVIVAAGFRALPHTPIGRRMILSSATEEGVAPPAAPAAVASASGIEVGMEGRATTDLRPAGTVFLGDRRVDVVADGDWIERGASVRVMQIEGNRVVVEAAPAS